MQQDSFLTSALHSPGESFRRIDHIAVFINEKPFLLCGNSENPVSRAKAVALVQNVAFLRTLSILGWKGIIRVGDISGCEVDWSAPKTVILTTDQETKTKQIEAVFLLDPHMTVATLCCVNDDFARIFKPDSAEWFKQFDSSVRILQANPGLSLVQ